MDPDARGAGAEVCGVLDVEARGAGADARGVLDVEARGVELVDDDDGLCWASRAVPAAMRIRPARSQQAVRVVRRIGLPSIDTYGRVPIATLRPLDSGISGPRRAEAPTGRAAGNQPRSLSASNGHEPCKGNRALTTGPILWAAAPAYLIQIGFLPPYAHSARTLRKRGALGGAVEKVAQCHPPSTRISGDR